MDRLLLVWQVVAAVPPGRRFQDRQEALKLKK